MASEDTAAAGRALLGAALSSGAAAAAAGGHAPTSPEAAAAASPDAAAPSPTAAAPPPVSASAPQAPATEIRAAEPASLPAHASAPAPVTSEAGETPSGAEMLAGAPETDTDSSESVSVGSAGAGAASGGGAAGAGGALSLPGAAGARLGTVTPEELARFEAGIDIPFEPPKVSWAHLLDAPRYYEANVVYPFLSKLLPYIDIIREEALSATRWVDWPEQNLYKKELGAEWTVLPFCHTFPAREVDKRTWVESGCSTCPRTAAILKKIPNIRTALLSRMGPNTTLSWHQGWAMLSNHVLRCHLPLVVPGHEQCGMNVKGTIRYHRVGEFIIFDDSKMHRAFNNHPTDTRAILIFDILRPDTLPPGEAEGTTTDALEDFKAYFK